MKYLEVLLLLCCILAIYCAKQMDWVNFAVMAVIVVFCSVYIVVLRLINVTTVLLAFYSLLRIKDIKEEDEE